MTKKITFSILLILSLTFTFCGKKEEAKEETKATETTAATGSKESTTQNAPDLAAKIKAYEDFVTKFCALSEKMKTATATEKVTLSAEFAKDSSNLKTLQADLDAAQSSPDEKAKIAAASKKAADCAAVAAGTSTPTKPSVPTSIPTKAPSIPGM